MSWLGGSLTSFTGQLSNLTKDILTEGTEEVSDHATELRIAQEKIAECQGIISTQKTENDRLKRLNHELEEKAESSELQINSISREYRLLLEEKEKEINKLKHSHEDLLLQQQMTFGHQTSHDRTPTSSRGFEHGEFSSDELDFRDSISMQHEINRLTSEVKRLKAEVNHWKLVSEKKDGRQTDTQQIQTDQVALQNRIQELEHQLQHEKEHHQQEMVLLQDVHSQKITTLHKKFKTDLAQYKDRLQEIEQNSAGNEEEKSTFEMQLDKLQEEKKELEKQNNILSSKLKEVEEEKQKTQGPDALQELKQQLKEKDEELAALQMNYDKVSDGLQKAKYQLLDQLDANHAQSLDLLSDLQEVRRNISNSVITRRNTFIKEKQDLVNLMIESGLQQKSINTSLEILEADQEQVSKESDHMLSEIGNSDHQQLTKDIIDTIEKENLMLKKKNLEQQEQIALLEKAMKTISEERQRKQQEEDKEVDDFDWNTDENMELTRINEDLNKQLQYLQQQILDHERNSEEYEVCKSDWETEKEALQEALVKLREQVREKETVIEAQKGLMEVADQERAGYVSDSEESVDSSNGDIGADVEKLDHKVGLLTQANAQLEEERDRLLIYKKSLEAELSTLREDPDHDSTLGRKLKEQEAMITSLREEKEGLENSLEELDSQHEEAMNQLIQIRNKIQQKLASSEKDCDDKDKQIKDLEKTIDRLQNEAKHLDDLEEEVFNLRESKEELELQLKNASVEKKTVIEKTECSKCSEMEELKKQMENGAMTINDLHMDVKELEQTLQKTQDEVKDKVSKIKDLRDNNSKLQQSVSELTEKLKEEEDRSKLLDDTLNKKFESEIEKLQQQIKEKSDEMKSLVTELDTVNTHLADYMERHTQLQMENSDLICKLSDRDNQIRNLKESVNQQDESIQNLNLQIEALGSEKTSIEKELDQKEELLQQKIKHYENYVQELKKEKETDSDSIQTEHQRLLQESHDKGMTILKFEEEIKSLESYVSETKDTLQSALDSQQQLSDIIKEKEEMITEMKEENNVFLKQVENLNIKIKQNEEKLASLQVMESQIKDLKKENEEMKEDLILSRQALQSENETEVMKSQTLDIITDLESELSLANEKIMSLEKEIKHLTETISGNELGIKELNEKNLEHIKLQDSSCKKINQLESSVLLLDEALLEKNEEIVGLHRKLQRAESLVSDDKLHFLKEDVHTNVCLDIVPKSPTVELTENLFLKSPEITEKDTTEKGTGEVDESENIHKLKQENEELRSEMQDLESKFAEEISILNEQLIQLENEKTNLMEAVEKSKVEYEKLSKLYNEQIEELKQTRVKLDTQQQHTSLGDEKSDENNEKHFNSSKFGAKEDFTESKSMVQEDFIEPEQEFLLTAKESPRKYSDVEEEVAKFKTLLKDKDKVIVELQTNNSALLKMLETKSLNSLGDKTLVDVHRLENEVRNLKIEKEQMLAVMNEKSRECSNLKSEVHRLMSTISAEKVALEKLQKDNQELTNNREKSSREDMQKEALQNLSRIIRDKDMEIEALTRKNETLVAVMQESSKEGSQINGLMQDKTNLLKQLSDLKSEREQMIVYLNQKHQESVSYHNEIQRLTEHINSETEKFQEVQHNYSKLVPQFEDNKQALIKVQNELINYKQKYHELEVRYAELDQRMNASETVDVLTHNIKLEENKRLQEKQKELFDSIKEKEMKLQTLHQQNMEYEESLSTQSSEISSLKKQLENMAFKLQSAQSELSDEGNVKSGLEQQVVEQSSNMLILKETNNKLTLALQEKEFEVSSLQEKSRTLQDMLQNKEGEKGQINKLMQENEVILSQAKQVQQERDQALMALKQRQLEQQEFLQEIQKLKEKENRSSKELDRLRNHLIQIEEGYTKEAIESEEREKDLRNRLASAEEKVMSSSSLMESASQQASMQTETLQQQLHVVASQRDQAYLQVSSLQDQNQQYAASLNNLQLVLEQFQKEKNAQMSLEIEHYQNEIASLKKQVSSLQTDLVKTKDELTAAEEGLEAASRLSEQLDKKEEALSAMKEEVHIREKTLKAAEEELRNLRISTDNKVDKLVIKNMLMGYFMSPKNKQPEVLRTVGGVLNFSEDDFNKISGSIRSWVPGFFRFGGSTPTSVPSSPSHRTQETPVSTPKADKSFSELFVNFLETESKPTPPVMKLPAEDMARDVQRHKQAQKDNFNPFTAPRHVSLPSDQEQHHRNSPILMSAAPLSPTIPLFTPVSSSQNSMAAGQSQSQTSSSAILKNVLDIR